MPLTGRARQKTRLRNERRAGCLFIGATLALLEKERHGSLCLPSRRRYHRRWGCATQQRRRSRPCNTAAVGAVAIVAAAIVAAGLVALALGLGLAAGALIGGAIYGATQPYGYGAD
jgi:hypothetical protein